MDEARRTELVSRAARARAALAECRLCAFRCGVDRTRGPAGRCLSDARPRVFYEGIEWAGEASLVPTYVVSFSGCNMTCKFCLTGESSQDGAAGVALDADSIASRIAARPELASVTILGGEPSIHLDGALELAARLSLPLVWKTNGYASDEGLALLGDAPAVVLADWKFGNDACAERLAGVPDYLAVLRRNLAATRERLIVRHLLMPGHLECCTEPVVRTLARDFPRVPLSLMTGFLPLFRAHETELARMNRRDEAERAWRLVRSSGVTLAPWTFARSPDEGGDDVIWIDRHGRLGVDSASPALATLLARLELSEFRLA